MGRPPSEPPDQWPFDEEPPESGGRLNGAKVRSGLALGLTGGALVWLWAASLFEGAESEPFLLSTTLATLLVPATLLLFKVSRPWAVGLLIGAAIASIALGRLCSWMYTGPGAGST